MVDADMVAVLGCECDCCVVDRWLDRCVVDRRKRVVFVVLPLPGKCMPPDRRTVDAEDKRRCNKGLVVEDPRCCCCCSRCCSACRRLRLLRCCCCWRRIRGLLLLLLVVVGLLLGCPLETKAPLMLALRRRDGNSSLILLCVVLQQPVQVVLVLALMGVDGSIIDKKHW